MRTLPTLMELTHLFSISQVPPAMVTSMASMAVTVGASMLSLEGVETPSKKTRCLPLTHPFAPIFIPELKKGDLWGT
jgi:hypothetical protein